MPKIMLLVAVTKDLHVQLAKIVSLLSKRSVVTPEDDVQDAVEFLAASNAQQSVLEEPVSL